MTWSRRSEEPNRPVSISRATAVRGRCNFENDEGRADEVSIDALLEKLRRRLPNGTLPPFFYLASCHGNEPAAPQEGKSGSESSAARLHREGVAQVAGYDGPIVDELSTRAEESLYGAIAEGQTTRYAVRQARAALTQPLDEPEASHRLETAAVESAATRAASPGPTAAPPHTHPFAWSTARPLSPRAGLAAEPSRDARWCPPRRGRARTLIRGRR